MTKRDELEPEGLSAFAWVTLGLWVLLLPAWMLWRDGLPENTEELERWLSAFVSAGTIWAALFARDAILRAIAAAIARVVGIGLAPISARLARLIEILRGWAPATLAPDLNAEQALREAEALEAEIRKLSQPPRSRTIWQWISGVFSASERGIRGDRTAPTEMPEGHAATTGKPARKRWPWLAILGVPFCLGLLAMLSTCEPSRQNGAAPGTENASVPGGDVEKPAPLPTQYWTMPEASVWETLRSCGLTGNLRDEILAVRDANKLDCPNLTPGLEVCRIKEGEPLLLPEGVQCNDRSVFQSREAALQSIHE
jgi:hypothetical protein